MLNKINIQSIILITSIISFCFFMTLSNSVISNGVDDALMINGMINIPDSNSPQLKFLQEVKQEAFKVSWPTGKETVQGALMVFAMAVVMSLFFLLIDQVLKFFLELLLKVSI